MQPSMDAVERRKIQNRHAQRRFRSKWFRLLEGPNQGRALVRVKGALYPHRGLCGYSAL